MDRLHPPRALITGERVRAGVAIALGAGVALSGFTPFNHASDVLDVTRSPWLVPLTPPVLLALAALAAAALFPARAGGRALVPLFVGGGLLIGAAGVSVLGSDDPMRSALLGATSILAPLAFCFGVLRADVPRPTLCLAFIVTAACLWLRADIVFFQLHGWPTPDAAFAAKYQALNDPSGFAYYGLVGATHSSVFLTMPLTLSLFWALGDISRRGRVALCLAAGFMLFNLWLVYERFAIGIGVGLAIAAILASPLPRRVRLAVLGAIAAAAALATVGIWDYLRLVPTSAGERLSSLGDGLEALWREPLTGVGLGMQAARGGSPHSSLIQAGEQMGVVGLAAVGLLTVWTCELARRTVMRVGWRGLRAAAALAAAVFCLHSLLIGGTSVWFGLDYVSTLGLSFGLLVAVAYSDVSTREWGLRLPPFPPAGMARVGAWVERYRSRDAAVLLRHRRIALGVYGALFATWIVVSLASEPTAQNLLGTRANEVHASLRTLNAGGPPLLETTPFGYFLPNELDQGIDLYLPLLGHIFGESDPLELMRWLFIAAVAIPIVMAPLVFSELFGSALVGLVAPVLLVWKFSFVENADLYWVPVWCFATTLPVLMLAYRRWGRRAIWSVAAMLAIASFADSMRTASGLPVFVAAIAVLLVSERSWRRRAAMGLCFLLAYLSVSQGVFRAVRAYRDDRAASATTPYPDPVPYRFGTASGFWHSAYIGLAFEPNDYGIQEFNDTEAKRYVRRVNPNARFLSPAYERTLRKRFLDLLSRDPGFVVGTEVNKALLTVVEALNRNVLLLVLLPAMLLLGRRRRLMRFWVALILPAAALWFLQPVVTVPFPPDIPLSGYAMGWLGAIGLIWILGVLWAVQTGPALILEANARRKQRTRDLTGPTGQPLTGLRARATPYLAAARPAAVPAAVALAGLVALLFLNHATDPGRTRLYYVLAATPLHPERPPRASEVEAWEFRGSLPSGWTALGGARVSPNGSGLKVRTGAGAAAYALTTRVRTLPPGRYRAVANAAIREGGLEVGVLDAAADRWVSTAGYWTQQTRSGPTDLPLDFTLAAPTRVRLVFTNFADRSQRSEWVVYRSRLLRYRSP